MNGPQHTGVLERGLESATDPPTIDLHPDGVSESSTGSSEDLSSVNETELSSRDKSNTTRTFSRSRPEILIRGENNRVFINCDLNVKFTAFEGRDEGDLSLSRTCLEPVKSWPKLNSSPPDISPEDVASDEEIIADSRTCHESSQADLFKNIDSSSHKIQNAFYEHLSQIHVLKNHLTEMEKENFKLQRENEVLKRENKKLTNKKEFGDSFYSPRYTPLSIEVFLDRKVDRLYPKDPSSMCIFCSTYSASSGSYVCF